MKDVLVDLRHHWKWVLGAVVSIVVAWYVVWWSLDWPQPPDLWHWLTLLVGFFWLSTVRVLPPKEREASAS